MYCWNRFRPSDLRVSIILLERTVIIKHSIRKRTRVGGRMVAKKEPDDTGVYSLPGPV